MAVQAEARSTASRVNSIFAIPWLILVRPMYVWRELQLTKLETPIWGGALLAQWLLLGTAQVLALLPSLELARYAGLTGNQLPPGWVAVLWQLVLFALGITVANLVLAGMVWCVARAVGTALVYTRIFTLTSCALLPAVLGTALNTTVFAICQPLTRQPAHALALLLRPFTFGCASLPPLSGEPLSIGWILASYFDVFGLWSLVVFTMGCVLYVNLTMKRTAWLVLGVVLSLTAGLLAWWRVLQFVAVR